MPYPIILNISNDILNFKELSFVMIWYLMMNCFWDCTNCSVSCSCIVFNRSRSSLISQQQNMEPGIHYILHDYGFEGISWPSRSNKMQMINIFVSLSIFIDIYSIFIEIFFPDFPDPDECLKYHVNKKAAMFGDCKEKQNIQCLNCK